MPKRARDRRRTADPLAALQDRLDRFTGDGTCVALILPLIGLAMRCTRPCSRCRALAEEVERLRPEWDAAKAAYLAEHPHVAPTRVTTTDDVVDEEDDL